MKSNNKITPHMMDKFNGITIGDEHIGPDKVEYVCSWCNRSLVRLSDRNNQSESWFCRNCSIEFNSLDDEQVSHKQKLSIPYQEDSEPAIASVGVTPDVSIRHEPTLKGGFAALAKKGTIRFTSYQES
jgi:DNA-directed RNA polymerase subunit RPC12/RpoP